MKISDMTATGYSGNPLVKKLGMKPEIKVLLVNAPADYFDLLEMDTSRTAD